MYYLIGKATAEHIRSHLVAAIARHPEDKNLHEALHQLDVNLHTTDAVPNKKEGSCTL